MASLYQLADYIWDTFSGGKGTTDTSAEEIEEAGKAYEAKLADITANTKSAKQLYEEGKEAAAAQANNKAGIAAKNAKAAAMQNSGSKLLSAIQGAEAANKATQEGYDTAANTAAGIAANIQSERNAALQAGAKNAYESSVAASQMRAKQAQERANADKNRMANIGTAFIQGLSE